MKGNRIFFGLIICISLWSCRGNGQAPDYRYNREGKTILIVNADDAGMHKDCDRAIFELLDQKKIQTLSVMVPGPNFKDAVMQIKKRGIPTGVHLTLTNEWQEKHPWSPILPKESVPSLYNEKGLMWESVDQLTKNASLKDIRKELTQQIRAAKDTGLEITHIDAHMLFWHKSRKIKALYYELAREHNLVIIPQEYFQSRKKQITSTNKLLAAGVKTPNVYEMFYKPEDKTAVQAKRYDSFIRQLKPGITHLAIHPAYKTKENQFMADQQMRYNDFTYWSGTDTFPEHVVRQNYLWMGESHE